MTRLEGLETGFNTLHAGLELSAKYLDERVRNLREEAAALHESRSNLHRLRQQLLEGKMAEAKVVPCELGLDYHYACHHTDQDLPYRLLRKAEAGLLFVYRHPGDNRFIFDTYIDIKEGEPRTMWVCREPHPRDNSLIRSYPLSKALPLPRDGQMFGVGSLRASTVASVIHRGEQYVAIDEGTELVVPAPEIKTDASFPENIYEHFGIPGLPKIPNLLEY